MPDFKRAFTYTANGRTLRTLITDCGICEAFDPRIKVQQKKIVAFKALWDTGATGTVISKNIAAKLSLPPTGMVNVFHADGKSLVNKYLVSLYLPNKVIIPSVSVTEGILNGFDILIGMDIISLGDFAITNFQGSTTFSFRIPSMEKIDFVHGATDNKSPLSQNAPSSTSIKTGRNEMCPCGSKIKYKFCHGKKQ